MGIFLRQSHNVKPSRWGSFADVQYAIRVNSEKIYGCDPDDDVLVMPLFWGLPALDYSGYNNHGTNQGATYKDGSLDFDGGNDYVNCGNNASLDITNQITIGAWVYPTANSNWNYILAKRDDVPTAYVFGLQDGHIFIGGGSNSNLNWAHGSGALLNNWYYVTGTINGTSGQVYVDGILNGTDSSIVELASQSSIRVALGARWNTYPATLYHFNGLIDEVRISKATRTADQIALFNDNKYGLYQPVGRPIWSIPAVGVTIPIFMQNMRGSFNSPGTRGGFIN